jgi:alpha-amylase
MLAKSGLIFWVEDGWAEFKCPGESLGVWAHKDAKGREEFGKNK